MQEVSINERGVYNSFTTRFRDVLRDLFLGSGIAGVIPLVYLIGKIRVVWLLRSDADDSMSHLGKISNDALNSGKVSLSWSCAEP